MNLCLKAKNCKNSKFSHWQPCLLLLRCHIVQKRHNVRNIVKCIAIIIVAQKVSTCDQDSEIQEKLENSERNNLVLQELVP